MTTPCATGFAQDLEIISSDTLADPDAHPWSIFVISSLIPSNFGLELGYNNMRKLLQNEGVNFFPFYHLIDWGTGIRYRRTYLQMQFSHSFFNTFTPGASTASGRLGARASYFCGSLSLGYAVWQNRNRALIVNSGVQAAAVELHLTDESVRTILNFNQLGNPFPVARAWPTLRHAGPALHFSVELVNGRPKKPYHIASTLCLGYWHGFGNERWSADNALVQNAPSDRTGMLYLALKYWLSRNASPKKR